MSTRKGEFTGRHMLMIMLAFFGVIIAVNVTMAIMATRSWSGIVVEDTYIASQEFNSRAAEGRAQAALGWQSELAIADGTVRYRLTDLGGAAVWSNAVTAVFRHPADEAADHEALLERDESGSFVARVDLPDGQWIVSVAAEVTALDQPYREARRVTIQDGEMQ